MALWPLLPLPPPPRVNPSPAWPGTQSQSLHRPGLSSGGGSDSWRRREGGQVGRWVARVGACPEGQKVSAGDGLLMVARGN